MKRDTTSHKLFTVEALRKRTHSNHLFYIDTTETSYNGSNKGNVWVYSSAATSAELSLLRVTQAYR